MRSAWFISCCMTFACGGRTELNRPGSDAAVVDACSPVLCSAVNVIAQPQPFQTLAGVSKAPDQVAIVASGCAFDLVTYDINARAVTSRSLGIVDTGFTLGVSNVIATDVDYFASDNRSIVFVRGGPQTAQPNRYTFSGPGIGGHTIAMDVPQELTGLTAVGYATHANRVMFLFDMPGEANTYWLEATTNGDVTHSLSLVHAVQPYSGTTSGFHLLEYSEGFAWVEASAALTTIVFSTSVGNATIQPIQSQLNTFGNIAAWPYESHGVAVFGDSQFVVWDDGRAPLAISRSIPPNAYSADPQGESPLSSAQIGLIDTVVGAFVKIDSQGKSTNGTTWDGGYPLPPYATVPPSVAVNGSQAVIADRDGIILAIGCK